MRERLAGAAAFLAHYHVRRRAPGPLTALEALAAARRPLPRLVVRRRDGGVPVEIVLRVRDASTAGYLCAALEAHGEPGERAAADPLEVVSVPRALASPARRARGLFVPHLVGLDLDLAHDPRGKDVRRRIARIERLGYQPEVVRDRRSFEELAHRMYLPTMRARHGEAAFVRSEAYLRGGFRHGTILMLRRGGRRVAGALNVRHPTDAACVEHWAGGVLDGDPALVAEGADAALLWFSMRWAREQPGVRRLGLTVCRPFGADGLLRFKMRWGARVFVEDVWSHWLELRFARWSPSAAFFARALAPIVEGRRGPVALVADGARACVDVPQVEVPLGAAHPEAVRRARGPA